MPREYKKHGERKTDFLAAAQRLFSDKGYESTTIADIIEAAGVSKGAFYHYFHSKEAVLDCLIEEMVHHVVEHLEELVRDANLPALEKLHRFFEMSRLHKFENRELIMAYIRIMHDERNCLMVHKGRRHSMLHVAPLIQPIIDQGIAEGVFHVPFPHRMAELLLCFWHTVSGIQAETILRLQDKPELVDSMVENLKMSAYAIERLLGAPAGSIHLVREESLRSIVERWVRPAEASQPGRLSPSGAAGWQ